MNKMKNQIRKWILVAIPAVIGWSNISSAQSIAGGGYNTMFLCNDNTPMVCGWNIYGQLGDGTNVDKITPISLTSLNGITAVAGGYLHSLFVKDDGTVWGTGLNNLGQLGDGTTTDKTSPIQVSGLTGIIAAAGANQHSLFLKDDGTVWSCGNNASGQLGDGTTTQRLTPVQITSLSGIVAIATGNDRSYFLKNDSTVWVCGSNGSGQLGDGTTTQRNTPVKVTSLSGIVSVISGNATLFLKGDGTVYACGLNFNGQLGNGTADFSVHSTPTLIPSLSGIKAIAASSQSLFLKNDGTVWACGDNSNGQLGDGTTTQKTTPVQITSLSGITAITTSNGGTSSSFFLKNDGTVWACGDNTRGQLGDGTTTQRNTPVQVNALCTVATGVNEETESLKVSVYPNPSNGIFQIEGDQLQHMNCEIYNMLGERIYTKQVDADKTEINISNEPKGIYFYQLKSKTNVLKTGKIIVD
jgi:alpha-tubulin suppressor-like RCC1 family protein